MLSSFIKTSTLHYWLSRLDSPLAIQEYKFLFDSTYALKSAATLDEEFAEDPLNDGIQAPSSTVAVPVPEDLFVPIKWCTVILCARLKFNGTVYSRAFTHVRNSQLFCILTVTVCRLLSLVVFNISILHPWVNWCLLSTSSSCTMTRLLIHLLYILIFPLKCTHQAQVVIWKMSTYPGLLATLCDRQFQVILQSYYLYLM
jgi:hypothetical protein